jgi:hypothetical protein
MHWVRARLRSGSFVALFALALQLVLSFGHVHLDGLGRHSSARVEASGASAPASPTGDPADHADGYCAICALIHLAGATVLATVPFLPVPVAFGRSQLPPTATLEAPTRTPSYFAARAPPVG